MFALLACVGLLPLALAWEGIPPSPMNFSDCDPLDPSLCMFPFPNNFWLRNTGGPTPTLYFSNDTFPQDWLGVPIRAEQEGWNGLDGFSPIPSIMTYFENAALDGCPRLWDIAASLAPTSCTILLDTVTGDILPHWTELDHASDDASGQQTERAFMIWPAHRLENSRRYIVAIRGLNDTFGLPIQPSTAFLDLRNGIPSGNWDVEGRRKVFADIFTRLTAVGVDTSTLQLAWDFTTGSRQNITGGMVHMRDDAFSRLPAAGPDYVIDAVSENYSSNIARMIQGHFMAPWYLNSPGVIPWVTSRLVMEGGLPQFQSFQPVNFTVLIPWSALEATAPATRVVQYGHGLFGDQSEVTTGYLQQQAQDFTYILCAVDWLGLSKYDAVTVGLVMATDLSNFPIIPDRLHQGMLDALLMMRLIRTSLSKDPLLLNPITQAPIVTTNTPVNYYGNSDGGIMGTVYMALTTEVELGCIGVGGGPFSLLLPRSVDATPFLDIIKLRYSSDLARMGLMGVMQLLWDRLEPSGYVDAISGNTLPGTPQHRVIFQYGLGDAQVNWLSTFQLARATNASMFKSNVREGNETIFGLNFVDDTAQLTSGNGVMGWDFGAPVAPFVNQPAYKPTDTHEKTRRTLTAQAQMHTFFTTGTIVNTCKGPCVNVSMVADA